MAASVLQPRSRSRTTQDSSLFGYCEKTPIDPNDKHKAKLLYIKLVTSCKIWTRNQADQNMSHLPKSYMPWHATESYLMFGRRFTSPAAKAKTILDEWRVAKVKHDEVKTLYEQTECTDRTAVEALKEESESERRQVAEIVERMKSMESFTIHNDRHLWLVFRFFFEHGCRAHVDIAAELEDEDDTEALQFLSGEYFGTEMPYDPEADFDDGCVCFVEVPLVNWEYYDGEDDYW